MTKLSKTMLGDRRFAGATLLVIAALVNRFVACNKGKVMKVEKVTVGGIDGNNGREYRVYFSCGPCISFDSMPGDKTLYSTQNAVKPSTEQQQYAAQAHEFLIAKVVGKYNQPITIYFATKLQPVCDVGGTIIQAQIDRLKADKAELLDALEALRDEQNGPPLVHCADQWQAAYDKANALLAKNNRLRNICTACGGSRNGPPELRCPYCDPITQLQAQSKHDELLEATRRLLEQFEKWEGYHQWDEEDETALERTRVAIAKVSHVVQTTNPQTRSARWQNKKS